MPERLWKVGELAARTGLTVRTLHHYDAIGLLCPSGRTGSAHGSGHRLYTGADVERLHQILCLKQLGFEGALKPIKVSCNDHEGARTGRIQTWDGKNWAITSDWYESDDSVIAPMVKEAAGKYAAEKKITPGCLATN